MVKVTNSTLPPIDHAVEARDYAYTAVKTAQMGLIGQFIMAPGDAMLLSREATFGQNVLGALLYLPNLMLALSISSAVMFKAGIEGGMAIVDMIRNGSRNAAGASPAESASSNGVSNAVE